MRFLKSASMPAALAAAALLWSCASTREAAAPVAEAAADAARATVTAVGDTTRAYDTLTVHYHRFDGDYDRPGLWVWDLRNQKNPPAGQEEVMASERTDYGVVFRINLSDYGNDNGPEEKIGFIPRLGQDWNRKDGGDRAWTPELGNEIWLIGNDPKIYTERPDVTPKVQYAWVDSPTSIRLSLSHPMERGMVDKVPFSIRTSEGGTVSVAAAKPAPYEKGGTVRFVDVTTAAELDPVARDYEVSLPGYRAATAKARRFLDDAQRFATTDPLGVTLSETGATFRLFSPVAKDVVLLVYQGPTDAKPLREEPMKMRPDGVWEVSLQGDFEGRHYRYRVTTARYGTSVINDPSATNTTGVDGAARITNLRALDPEGFRPIARPFGGAPTDAIVYQLHIRDFTIAESSGVDEALRGKYLGFVQAGTHVPGSPDVTTGIDHLRDLGVTHVQLLPMQDFDNDESNPTYNWGYMTAFFNSPEGMYATGFRDESRIREFKEMVHGLKRAGIAVVMDVVYNHTGVQNTLEAAAPSYYLRMRDDGSFWNGSGTGNEVRSEAPMARRYIIDSLKMWAEEYGIDGFRFDLMGLIDLPTLQQAKAELRAIYPSLLFYGEPWAAAGPGGVGIDRIVYKDVVKGTGIGAFNDHYRDALKGSPNGDDPGYIVNGGRRDGVVRGLMGSIDDWAASPAESVNYGTVHDNLDLWDKLEVSAKGTSEEDRMRMAQLYVGLLSVSQGMMLLHGGVDFARYKFQDHNSYNSGDRVNQIDWNRKVTYRPLHEFTRGAIALRKAHPVFRLRTAEEVRARVAVHDGSLPSPECIVLTLDAAGVPGETWEKVIVLVNPTKAAKSFTLPIPGEFGVYMNAATAGTERIGSAEGTYEVGPWGIAVLAR
jgi:pullulanase